MLVPSVPQTGKGAKVSLSFNDGIATTGFAMTMQASYSYNGETLTDKVYLLGSGKMINSRPAANPFVYIDGILDGADISSTVADKLIVTAGNMLVGNATVAIVADASLNISRPAATQACWTAIVVDKATGVVSEVKGTDTTAATGKAGLLNTYGIAAGQKPLIAADELLLVYIGIDATTGVIASSEFNYSDREWSSFSYQMMPSIGGIKIAESLPKIHTGGVSRSVYFSGKYWESSALAAVGDAQQWSVTPNTSSVSAVTFTGGPSESQIDNWSFTFNQLFTDSKALDAIYNRQGYAAVKLQLASGQYFMFVGSFAGGISVEPGSFIIQSLSGSIQDRPYWSGQ
jgi:hypothetical protein